MDYTRKEAETIRAAFGALDYWASCRGCSAEPLVDDALRYERSNRHSLANARALIVREAFNAPGRTVRGLYGTSRGLIFAIVAGAELANDVEDAYASDHVRTAAERFRRLAPAAIEAHEAAMERAHERSMELIRGER